MVDYKTRQELNALSKEVFGSSSKWQKLVTKGYSELITEEVEEYVPGETDKDGVVGEGSTRKVQIPVKLPNGAHQSVWKYHTPESVKTHMVERKRQLEELRALVEKMKAEEKAKKDQEELTKQVQAEASGSAL